MNSRGFSLIETLVALPLALTLLSGVLGICYYACAQQWLRHQVHEAAICADHFPSLSFCEEQTKENVTTLLPLGKMDGLKIKRTATRISVAALYQLFDFDIYESQSLKRPIQLKGL